ncbi:MoaD/ThiS family protein [Pelotomaculum propionicicum]|uniref:MoaD/ThiS family protein n=1 Tax=Pelotomaculum propionicicum TaxID=258475 RepID=UPI003B8108A2
MQVEVRVFSGLEVFIPGTTFGQVITVGITEGFTGRELLKKLNIPEEKVFTFLVNGVHKNFEVTLNDGDRVSLFPAVGGG